MFGFRVPNLAELHTALVEDSLKEQLEESVPTGLESSLTQLPVCRDELCYHRAGLLKTLHPGRARVPILRDTGREIRNPHICLTNGSRNVVIEINNVKLSF